MYTGLKTVNFFLHVQPIQSYMIIIPLQHGTYKYETLGQFSESYISGTLALH